MQARSKQEEDKDEARGESSPEEAEEESGSSDDDQEQESQGGEESPAQSGLSEDETSDEDAHLGSPDDACDAGMMCSQCDHGGDADESHGHDEGVNQKVGCCDDCSGAETVVLGSLDQAPVNNDDGDDVSDLDTQPDSPDVENLCTPEKHEYAWREELFQSPMMGRAPAPHDELQEMCAGLLEHFGEFHPEIAAILILCLFMCFCKRFSFLRFFLLSTWFHHVPSPVVDPKE